MRTKEIADICGVTEECIRQNAKKVGIVLENGKAHEYTEDELKKVQLELMKNQTSQGSKTQGGVVESNLQSALEVGLVAKACLETPEAWEQFKKIGDRIQEQKKEIQLEQQKNKELQAIVDKYINWMSKSEIKTKYNLPSRPGIDKVALALGLKEGEDWVKRFYDDKTIYWKILYSPAAVERIVEYILGD